ncbi:MAG: hypothetical protein PHI85_10385 [Victivallaceae bacterium]|nr:hypothetical protein [Victivallaceae bacterium]
MKKFLFLAPIALMTVFFCGCETLRQAKIEPAYVMTFYSKVQYPGQTDMIETEIVSPFDNKSYWVNGNQFFDSRNIEEIKMEQCADDPDHYYLYFKLTRMGINRWTAMCGHNLNNELVLMVDGNFYAVFTQKLDIVENQKDWVKCGAKFDEYTARGIVDHAKDNYTYYNPDINMLF